MSSRPQRCVGKHWTQLDPVGCVRLMLAGDGDEPQEGEEELKTGDQRAKEEAETLAAEAAEDGSRCAHQL